MVEGYSLPPSPLKGGKRHFAYLNGKIAIQVIWPVPESKSSQCSAEIAQNKERTSSDGIRKQPHCSSSNEALNAMKCNANYLQTQT